MDSSPALCAPERITGRGHVSRLVLPDAARLSAFLQSRAGTFTPPTGCRCDSGLASVRRSGPLQLTEELKPWNDYWAYVHSQYR